MSMEAHSTEGNLHPDEGAAGTGVTSSDIERQPDVNEKSEWTAAPKANRAQAHLANERTYLAWTRTAFTSIALGIAIARFGGISTDNTVGAIAHPTTKSLSAGGLFIALGGLGIIYGTWRYKRINRQLESGYFIIGSRGKELPMVSVLMTACMITAMALLFSG